MDDNNLKKLLHKNSKVPLRPVNEWVNILAKIESKKSISIFNLFKFERLSLGIVSIMVLVIAGNNIYRNQVIEKEIVNKKKLEAFLTSELYFDDISADYAWVDKY